VNMDTTAGAMDEEQFRRSERPGRRGSQLSPHLASIRRLRAEGYTLRQVCKWLRTNDVSVSVAGLSIFLKRAEQKAVKPGPARRKADQ
jgi:hypothetical protein